MLIEFMHSKAEGLVVAQFDELYILLALVDD